MPNLHVSISVSTYLKYQKHNLGGQGFSQSSPVCQTSFSITDLKVVKPSALELVLYLPNSIK